MAQLILGSAVAATIEAVVQSEAATLAAAGRKPHLVALRVGAEAASDLYLKRQAGAAARLGLEYEVVSVDATADEAALLRAVDALNARTDVTGVIIQMPLPKGIRAEVVQERLHPAKDVEGIHAVNLGRLLDASPAIVPCTAAAAVECLLAAGQPLTGMEVVVVGRSRIVGRPAALLLAARDATVTLCHSRTRDLASHTRRADAIVMAVGRAGMLTAAMVRPGAIVIDVGINEIQREGKRAVVGDVDPSVAEVAGWMTPVPGGVGPVTVALLWRNAVRAAR